MNSFHVFSHQCARFANNRDLKPENVLIGEDMHIKLTDFGTAKILDGPGKHCTSVRLFLIRLLPSGDRANSFVGTAEYVSPELLIDKICTKRYVRMSLCIRPYSNASSDLWAIGCIVYHFLAGKPPMKGANEYQTFQKITSLDYSFPAGFPQVAEEFVRSLLVTDIPLFFLHLSPLCRYVIPRHG